MTVLWPLTATGAGEAVVQTAGETRLVVDCIVNPVALGCSFVVVRVCAPERFCFRSFTFHWVLTPTR